VRGIIKEIEKREKYIEDIVKSGVRDQRQIAEKILSYYNKQRNQRNGFEGKIPEEDVITNYLIEDAAEATQE
jgi:hypothetical protein